VGLPGQTAALAQAAPELRPRTVLLSGDYVPVSAEERLRRTWGCEVFTHWGMTETGYGGAVDCPRHSGAHLREDLLIEIADPETGEPLPAGETGEIVVSAPERQAMPLFRYRTGDIGRLARGICGCGRPEPRLDRVLRRAGDEIPVPGGSLSIHELDECLFAVPGVRDFRAVLTGEDVLSVTWDGPASAAEVEGALRRRWPELRIESKNEPLPPEREKRRLERRTDDEDRRDL
jgi:phenylacetate-coenzyme A ligase PaaK-like adenylate-forming protein